jgi:tripartite-type tricarboxylate transporter receptor subunit TctC
MPEHFHCEDNAMRFSRRQFLHLATAAAVLPTATSVGSAQTFPTRPITIVVPYPAGGPADAIARIVGERMRMSFGQPVIVENVSGAGGTLGVARVARAAPDGYTLSIGQLNSHVFSGAVYSAPYDLLRDLAPVALLTTNPLMIVGKRDLPASNLKELIGWLKANPDKASFGDTRCRQPVARLGGLLPSQNRHSLPVRALSRWRTSAPGPGIRPD